MKIDNTIKPTSSGSVSSDSKTRPARAEAAAPAQGDSRVQLSSLSSRLQQIEQVIGQAPVVDSGRVAEIKNAISEGRFSVNPEKVADGLIDSVRQMLSAQPRNA